MKRWSVVSAAAAAAAGLLMTFSLAKAGSVSFPSELQSYVHDGHFEVGDFAWMRGAFPGANDEQKKRWEHLLAYSTACLKEATKQETEALLREGEKVSRALAKRPYADERCSDVWNWSLKPYGVETWQDFTKLVKEEHPVVDAYLKGIEDAQLINDLFDNDGLDHETERLMTHVLSDQAIRRPMENGADLTGSGYVAELKVRGLRISFINSRAERIDHAGTRWLKKLVMEKGWPSISRVGPIASTAAWLLVQHADDDIVFQAQMLKFMTPLAKKKDLDPANYALLADRVTFALTGHQIYGSQMMCEKGKLIPLPLENPTEVNERRHSVGLGTVKERIKEMEADGGCL